MRVPMSYLIGVTLVLAACSGTHAPPATAATIPGTQIQAIPAMAMPMPVLPAPSAPGGVPLLPEIPALTSAQASAEAVRLRAALLREVPNTLSLSPESKRSWIARAQAMAAASALQLDRPQLVVVVDRNPRVQELVILLASPTSPWEVIGGTRVSTGQPGRKLYYITPTGVFLHTADILDFRAEGTFNENHIRGYGLKGMRIWDFGWQWATKGWRADGERGQIRLQMHATDPQYLESRIGRPASEGCVRVPAALNRFLDRHGVLDADYEQEAVQDIRYRALLLPDRSPSPLSGHTLIVVDSRPGPSV